MAMDYIFNGIVLKCQDYKDKDVLVTIFTAEVGKITAVLKGVRGAKAKLKFAAQPFCFGEWTMSEKGGKYTVTSVSAENLFFELTADYDRYTLACSMLQMCDFVLKPNMLASNLLVHLLNALKVLTYDDIDERLVMLKFMMQYSNCIGYGFSWDTCGNCGCNLIGKISYSIGDKSFTCPSCASFGSVDVPKVWYTNLKIIDQTDVEKLDTIHIKEDIINNCMYVMKIHIENVVGLKLSALNSWS